MDELIFGYTWADIQRAQQGGHLAKPIQRTAQSKEILLQGDTELLTRYGLAGLKSRGFDGVIDRLQRAGIIAS